MCLFFKIKFFTYQKIVKNKLKIIFNLNIYFNINLIKLYF